MIMSALTIIKNLTLTLALGLSLSASAAVLQFPTESHFATGHWVKVNYTKTGIYEISYDELKAMGFSDPGKVAVFGHGGYLQDAQFVDAEGKALYQTELQPVAMYRAGDKLFFYGQGPELLRQMIENNNRKDSMQFERVNRNFYSQGGSYFLTDSREGMIPEEVLRTYNYSLPRFYYGFMVDYHEADTSMPNSFGREAFGETLTPGTPLTFQYSLPGVLTKDFTPSTASEKALNLNTYLTLRAANNSSSYSSLKTSVGNGTDDISYSFGLQQANRTDYYTTNRMRYLYGRIPSESGTITFDLNGAPTWANLDYYILAGRARMTFPEDAASITYYVNDYDPTKNGGLNLNIMPSDIVAWDVVNPNDVSQLSVQLNGDGGWLRYYRQGKNLGNLVAFSPSRTQMSIDSWSQVSATSLHKLGTETMPALLIITLPEYEQQARRIADLHKRFEGIETAIVFSEDVFNEFSAGVPDPIAYRALAKMIYDRDDPADRKFKNILMLGPTLRDFANIEGKNPGATLLCNLTPDGANLEQTFTLNDWYGMLEDRTLYTPNDDAANFAQVPMQVGVGNLPAQSPADADVYIDKLEAYYADNSFASWLTETIFVADAGDDNEHQNMSDNCFDDLMQTSGRAFTGNKLYTNFYPAGGVTQAFIKNSTRAPSSLPIWATHPSLV